MKGHSVGRDTQWEGTLSECLNRDKSTHVESLINTQIRILVEKQIYEYNIHTIYFRNS